jgi:hypothetical protein
MKRLFIAIAMLLWFAVFAFGQSPKVLLLGAGGPPIFDNESYFRPGTHTVTSFTVTAGESLMGLGAGTTTLNANASVTSGSLITFPSAGSTTASGLRIESPDVLTESIQGDDTEEAAFALGPTQEIGVTVNATEVGRLTDCEIEGFRNYGAVMTGTGTHRKLSIDDCKFFGNWHGFKLVTDSKASGNMVAGALERGIDLQGSAIQLSDNHAYGCKYALYAAPAFAAGSVLSTIDRFEDSNYGIYLNGNFNYATFIGTKLYNNFQRGAWIEGTAVTFIAPTVSVPHSSPALGVWPDKVGIEFVGDSNTIIGGTFILANVTQSGHGTATASTAIRVSGVNCLVNTTIQDVDGLNGSKGLNLSDLELVRGGEIVIRIYGFEGTGDAALVIDTEDITGVTATIIGNSVRSAGFDHTDVDQYIDIPAGWDASGANANVFYITDEATGQTTTVSDGLAH